MAVKQRFPWVGVSAIVASVLLVGITLLRLPQGGRVQGAKGNLPNVGLAQLKADRAKELIAERLAAYDPSPFFMPTPMNSVDPVLPDNVQSGVMGPFAPIAPELTKTEALPFASVGKLPRSSVDGLALTGRSVLPLVMQRGDALVGAMKPVGARVEAISAEGGEVVLTIDLPAADFRTDVDLQPLELTGFVSREGFLGELAVIDSSGSNEVDAYFKKEISEKARLGYRLPAGIYIFRVGS